MTSAECIFCKIAAEEMSADVVYRDEETVAFRDINPQAPVHVLVIPRRHIPTLDAMDAEDAELAGGLLHAAREVAEREGVADSGYRLVINNGEDAAQTVDHIHLHVLGGRRMTWPPG